MQIFVVIAAAVRVSNPAREGRQSPPVGGTAAARVSNIAQERRQSPPVDTAAARVGNIAREGRQPPPVGTAAVKRRQHCSRRSSATTCWYCGC